MTTSLASESERSELSAQNLPTNPTVEDVTTWHPEELLQWIQQKSPKLLMGENAAKFTASKFFGEGFLRHAGEVDFFMKAGLPIGVSNALASLGDEVGKGKFIPWTCLRHQLTASKASHPT